MIVHRARTGEHETIHQLPDRLVPGVRKQSLSLCVTGQRGKPLHQGVEFGRRRGLSGGNKCRQANDKNKSHGRL